MLFKTLYMKYYFKISNIRILVETEFEIHWNKYILNFVTPEFVEWDVYYKCILTDILNVTGKKVYQDEFQEIFLGINGEERLHYFVGFKEPCMLYREESDVRYIYLNKRYIQAFIDEDNYSIFNAMAFEKVLMQKNAVILHSCFVIHNGEAIIFSAPSGTGKSTQGDLWTKYRNAIVANGDRTILSVIGDHVIASGLPICGSSNVALNVSVPVKAIVYLSQAPENEIQKTNYADAVKHLVSETTINYFNQEFFLKAFDVIENIAGKIPLYELACTPDERAVETLEEVLKY